jgi:outer membrane lipoprotein-sorting protein
MDALTLLQAVGETYARLTSFEVEIVATKESGDEDFKRSTRRARAFFVSPDKMRVEQSGLHGMVMVSDGVDVHRYHRRPEHYFSGPVEGQRLEGFFHAAQPAGSGMTFLFDKIAASVVAAEIEDSVVSVVYDPAVRPGFIVASSPVRFWIDPRTMLVSRMECEVTYRISPDREESSSRHRYEYTHAFVNQEIPAQTFQYAPPEGAVDESAVRRRGGCGTGRQGADGYKTWHAADWEDEEFVDRFELKIRGMELEFERRLRFGEKSVEVAEKVSGPGGVTERGFSVRVSE